MWHQFTYQPFYPPSSLRFIIPYHIPNKNKGYRSFLTSQSSDGYRMAWFPEVLQPVLHLNRIYSLHFGVWFKWKTGFTIYWRRIRFIISLSERSSYTQSSLTTYIFWLIILQNYGNNILAYITYYLILEDVYNNMYDILSCLLSN